MRVLFICGQIVIEKAVPAIKRKLNGAIELDTLSNLEELGRYFSKGHTFDKCVVLAPDRLIPNYTHDLLEGEMAKFKNIIQSKCTTSVDIVLCVTKEQDGLELAEQFSDMLGSMITILQVDEKLSLTTMMDLIRQQGSTLTKRLKSYDLTTLARMTAEERLGVQNNDTTDYKSLDELMQQQSESGVMKEEYISSVGVDSVGGDTEDLNNFNTNGFTDTSSAPADLFETDFSGMSGGTQNSGAGQSFDGPGLSSGGSAFGGMGMDADPFGDDPFGNTAQSVGVDDDPFGNNMAGAAGAGVSDTSGAFGTMDTADLFGMDTQASNSMGDIFEETAEESVKKPAKQEEPQNNLGKLGSLATPKKTQTAGAGGLGVLGAGKKADTAQDKPKGGLFGGGAKKTEPAQDRPKGGLFGGGAKKAQPIVSYEDKAPVNNTASKPAKGGLFGGGKAKKQEVSGRKNIGLAPIEEEPEVEVDPLASTADTMSGTGIALAQYDEEEEQRMRAPDPKDTISSLYDIDSTPQKTVEKGAGTGLNPKDLTTGRKKAGKRIGKELGDLLKPYLKRGGLFVVTGSHGTGKTVISANIANLLCRYGYRVCVLDLDLQGKGQSYLNLDTFKTVHGGFQSKMNSVHVINSTGTDFAKWIDVIREGYHIITTTLNSDVEETHTLIRNDSLGRLVRQLTGSYNFVVVDVEFHDLVTYYKEFADTADALICVEEATQRGLTNFMLNMTNIDDEDVENVMFSRVNLVLNKEDGMKSLFGKKVSKTSDVLDTLDDVVAVLTQQIVDYTFTSIPIISILKYSNAYEKFWYTNKYITDTKEGENLFSELLQNALNN